VCSSKPSNVGIVTIYVTSHNLHPGRYAKWVNAVVDVTHNYAAGDPSAFTAGATGVVVVSVVCVVVEAVVPAS
jgi:hypothetical protein